MKGRLAEALLEALAPSSGTLKGIDHLPAVMAAADAPAVKQ